MSMSRKRVYASLMLLHAGEALKANVTLDTKQ